MSKEEVHSRRRGEGTKRSLGAPVRENWLENEWHRGEGKFIVGSELGPLH